MDPNAKVLTTLRLACELSKALTDKLTRRVEDLDGSTATTISRADELDFLEDVEQATSVLFQGVQLSEKLLTEARIDEVLERKKEEVKP
jgi:hypothetical protein